MGVTVIGRLRGSPAFRAIVVTLPIFALVSCAVPRWPVDNPLSSPFGARLVGFSVDVHYGVDLLTPLGSEVRAMYRGRVRYARALQGYGEAVQIDHGDGLESLYAHLSEIRVEEGQRVDGGHVIGLSGQSGHSRGAHLHFEVWLHGRPIDPVRFLGGPPGG